MHQILIEGMNTQWPSLESDDVFLILCEWCGFFIVPCILLVSSNTRSQIFL